MAPAPDDLDDLDLLILDHLARNARATFQEIADATGVRRPTVHARVKQLEQQGVLRGHQADIDPEAIGAGLCAFVLLRLDCGGSDCATASDRAATALRDVPEVLEFHIIAGQEDALVKVRARDMRDLERVTTKVLSGAPGVARIQTLIALSTSFERRPQPLRRAPGRTAVRSSARATSRPDVS